MNEVLLSHPSPDSSKPSLPLFGRWNIDADGVRRCRECKSPVIGSEKYCPTCGLPLQYRTRNFTDISAPVKP